MKEKYQKFHYDICDSTSTRAREYINENPDVQYAVFTADGQSAGRGRQGKSFYSPKSTGLYMSVIMPAKMKLEDTVSVTSRAAVAVCRALCEMSALPLKIKWVNDIYLYDKKVCGTLCEKTGDRFIIGVGVNLTTEDFPEDIKNKAGSLGNIDKNELSQKITDGLFCMWQDTDYLDYYRENSCVIGKNITYIENNQEFFAKAVAIDQNGGLIVENAEKMLKILQSGEISVHFC